MEAANRYAWDNLEKGEAMALKARASVKITFQIPSDRCQVVGVIEPLASPALSTVTLAGKRNIPLSCEELKTQFPEDATALEEAGKRFLECRQADHEASDVMRRLCRDIADPAAEMPAVEAVLAARSSISAAVQALDRATEDFGALNKTCFEKLGGSLGEAPIVWVVAGVSP